MQSPAQQDPLDMVAAALVPAKLNEFEPLLRSLLAGTQTFIRQPDGRYRPRGCALGLAQCFDFSDLVIFPS
jgi:hypothetical protein